MYLLSNFPYKISKPCIIFKNPFVKANIFIYLPKKPLIPKSFLHWLERTNFLQEEKFLTLTQKKSAHPHFH